MSSSDHLDTRLVWPVALLPIPLAGVVLTRAFPDLPGVVQGVVLGVSIAMLLLIVVAIGVGIGVQRRHADAARLDVIDPLRGGRHDAGGERRR